MSKKTKKIVFLSIGYILTVLFLQTIYKFFYEALPPEINPTSNWYILTVNAFMSPNGLTVIISILFVIGITVIALFGTY